MGELAQAMRGLGKIDKSFLISNNGKYFFVGRVDSRLYLSMPDGSFVPDDILAERARCGMPALVDKKYGLKRMAWSSETEALEFANNLA